MQTTTSKNLTTYEWWGKRYTSQQRLNDLFAAGRIDRTSQPTEYGSWYTFTTKEGAVIATFYKDAGYGFCSQATGIELKTIHAI